MRELDLDQKTEPCQVCGVQVNKLIRLKDSTYYKCSKCIKSTQPKEG